MDGRVLTDLILPTMPLLRGAGSLSPSLEYWIQNSLQPTQILPTQPQSPRSPTQPIRQKIYSLYNILFILTGYIHILQTPHTMSLPIKVAVVVLGLVFYFFSISSLLSSRRDKAEHQVFFDSIDWNGDGVLTTQQINSFRPCPQSNRSKLIARLNSIGPSVTFDQFETDVSKNMMKYALAPCAVDAPLFANPAEISKRTTANTVEPFFALYDLNRDGIVRYNQYQLINKFHGRSIKGSQETFVYLDANNDWELTRNEVTKAKLENLDPKLPASVRRKPPPPRHGHHAPAAPAAAAAPTAATPSQPRAYTSTYTVPVQRTASRAQDNYQRDRYRDPVYADAGRVGPGEYDIVVDPNIPASQRIQRERLFERQARESRYQQRVDPYYQPRQPEAPRAQRYVERTQYQDRVPVQDQYQTQPPRTQRLQAAGRLDTLSGPRPRVEREPAYRERGYYEQGL